MPDHLFDDFMEALADPDYLNNREAIAASKARELELMRRIKEGCEGNRPLLKLLEANAERAFETRDTEDLVAACRTIQEVLPELIDTDALWQELRRQQDHTRKLKETDSRLREQLGQRLDKDRAMALMT